MAINRCDLCNEPCIKWSIGNNAQQEIWRTLVAQTLCIIANNTNPGGGGAATVLPQVNLTAATLASSYVTYADTGLLDSSKKLNYIRVLNQSDANVDISLDGGATTAFTVLAYTSYEKTLGAFVAAAQDDVQLKVSSGFTAGIGNVFIEGSYQ